MMKAIHIKFNRGVPDDARNEYRGILSQWFEVIESEKYDYYFAMETIYTDQKNMQEMLESDQDAVRIMICGEALYPDLNLFDYAIFYWGHYESMGRIISRPYLFSLEGELFDTVNAFDESKVGLDVEKVLSSKNAFCNFIYSNANAHYMRDEIFWGLSRYKRVDSLGRHLKNTEITDTRNDIDWRKKSIDLKKPYKFSIATENARFPGYTTEKLITSMLAFTIPIYFGNPVVYEIYNANSIIQVEDYCSIEELVDRIKEIDENDQLWCDIMMQPWRTEEQVTACNMEQKTFYGLVRELFEKEKNVSFRRSRGTWDRLIYPKHIIDKKKPRLFSNLFDFIK